LSFKRHPSFCGKVIAQSDDTYLTTVNLRQKFIQLKEFLTISEQPRVEAEKVESLKSAIRKLQEELTRQKQITDTISEGHITIKNENVDLRERITRTEQRLAELEKLTRRALEQTN